MTDLKPIGTKVIADDGFEPRLGMVTNHTTNRWGTFHEVLLNGKLTQAGFIGNKDHKGIGFKEATDAEFKRIATYAFC
jgi:hypothetical protein